MAQSQSKPSNNGLDPQGILLPLVPLPPSEMDSTASVVYPLLSDPSDTNSAKYKVTVRRLNGSEDVRTMINWSKDVNKVLAGLDIKEDGQYTQAVTVCLSMMDGRVTTLFNFRLKHLKVTTMEKRAQKAFDDEADPADKPAAKQAVLNAGWAHADNNQFTHIRLALNDVLGALMPKKVLARCKRHLRRHCRKPKDMKIREYSHLVQGMNTDEFTHLPPFGPYQNLTDDEILDIILFGIPRSWEREMERQGFDPLNHSLLDVIAKLEDIETAENFDATATKVVPKSTKKKSSPKSSNSDNQGSNNSNGKKHCMFHGWGGHTTDECDKLKQQVKKLKTDNNSSSGKKDENAKKQGDWKKKADKAKKEGDNFAMTMNKMVKKAVKTAIKNNKRRSTDDSSEGSLAAFEKMEVDDFDYNQMENMVITEDGEIIV